MEFYEFKFLSTHYHIVLYDRFGRVCDFIKDLDAIIARELNAIRGTSGKFFDGSQRPEQTDPDSAVHACRSRLATWTSRPGPLGSTRVHLGLHSGSCRRSAGLHARATGTTLTRSTSTRGDPAAARCASR